jgi:hypothetical protein
MNPKLVFAVLVVSLVQTSAVGAQTVDIAARSAARELAVKGKALAGEGRAAEALDAFNRADDIMHLPSLGLEAARCLVKLDRWVEASERFRTVARMDYEKSGLNQTQRDLQEQARQDAQREGGELGPKIPCITIVLAGGAADVALYLDDRPLPAALAGVEIPVDPGERVVRVERGEWKDSGKVSVKAGEKTRLEFTVPVLSAPAVVTPPEAPAQQPIPPTTPTPEVARRLQPVADSYEAPPGGGDTQESHSSTLRTGGWVAAGLGVVGIGVGVTMALVARSQNEKLAKACPDQQCIRANWSAVDSYNNSKLASTIGFVAGGACLVAGVILVLVAPSGEQTSDPRLAFGIGPRSAQVRIRF